MSCSIKISNRGTSLYSLRFDLELDCRFSKKAIHITDCAPLGSLYCSMYCRYAGVGPFVSGINGGGPVVLGRSELGLEFISI